MNVFSEIVRFLPSPSVFENSGNLVVREVATQPLTQDLLLSSVKNLIWSHLGSASFSLINL